MYNYTPLTNLATSMPAIVAWSVIASRNSDPPSENLTNTALVLISYYIHSFIATREYGMAMFSVRLSVYPSVCNQWRH